MVVSNVMVSSLDEQQCKTWAHLYHCIIEQEMAIFRAWPTYNAYCCCHHGLNLNLCLLFCSPIWFLHILSINSNLQSWPSNSPFSWPPPLILLLVVELQYFMGKRISLVPNFLMATCRYRIGPMLAFKHQEWWCQWVDKMIYRNICRQTAIHFYLSSC